MRIKNETYTTIFHMVYAALATNVLLMLGCAPLVLGLIATDPTRSWPLLALTAPLCTPALVAAFAVLGKSSSNTGSRKHVAVSAGAGDSAGIVRGFVRVWLACWRRATTLGSLATAALVVIGVDMRWAWGRQIGAVAIPVLATLAVLVLCTAMLACVALAERPTARLREVLRCSVYFAVRRWYLTLLSLAAVLLLLALFASRPALAIGLAASPLLYVVWANSRFSLRPVLDPAPAAT